MFQPVPTQVSFAAQEREVLAFWQRTQAFERLRSLRANAGQRYSFLDGPITANNPMGVHHAWGRTYKDMWQRYYAMLGRNERWQNGFDCQGLWVEVNVERDLGYKTKRDIETNGIQQFINLCKQRVLNSAAMQTEQSIRLGYWMDWNDSSELRMLAEKIVQDPEQHITLERTGPAGRRQIHGTVEQLIGRLGSPELGGSYFTFSDENNYQIWGFLKKCAERGWVYRGSDVIPWCPRCATGISQHEIDTEGYRDRTDPSVVARLTLTSFDASGATWQSPEAKDAFDRNGAKYLLVWTTTPWTLPANVMAAVGPALRYAIVKQADAVYILSTGTLGNLKGEYQLLGEINGAGMVGWTYRGLFDQLPAWNEAQRVWTERHPALPVFDHKVIEWDEVGEAEGTGIVHIAPGCGPEDFHLGRKFDSPSVAPLNEDGIYVDGFGPLAGKYAHDVAPLVMELLRSDGNFYRTDKYTHRYPHCWRCGAPLVYRLVDEWYISMDQLRHDMMRVSEQINWVPSFGKERELDWLKNMHDWMISKKRYWGLALPIWEYPDGTFEVIGSREELQARAVEGWEEFDGHSPHRPHVDKVKIRHPVTGQIGTRVPDVGNPWLDAGIVAFSTMQYRRDPDYWRTWFPANFITESFPGQFRNWFYALIAMSTVLEGQKPTQTVLGFATLLDSKGQPMHKSSGNMIEFNEAAEKAGADMMRWVYARQRYDDNLWFGYEVLDEVRRSFFIPLWNVYSFFVNYANIDKWTPPAGAGSAAALQLQGLDKWILARLSEVVGATNQALQDYDARTAAFAIEKFVDDLSNWFVRRSRRRFWRSETDADKQAAYSTLYEVLTTLCRLLAPFAPFISEVMWQNLAYQQAISTADTIASVHHQSYPVPRALTPDEVNLLRETEIARRTVNLGHSTRAQSKVKLRQPLARAMVVADESARAAIREHADVISDELNVKGIEFVERESDLVTYKIMPDSRKLGPKFAGDFPKVRAALAALDPFAVAAAVKAQQPVAVQVNGHAVTLAPEDILVQAMPREGLIVAGEEGIVVALDTKLTEKLEYEGLAREVVRHLNDLRKEAGLELTDRIMTEYSASAKLEAAFSVFSDYIRTETLSVRLEKSEFPAGKAASDSFDGESLTIGIVKV
ncbi:MAG: class I tRNA ligase family protein [Chloroflexi bacterium]|nr:class I tRNA ligase family protein [Chloroflexota bacterium]MCL5275815.1 class I tRNA ligase family protein [Chloroflexota bacterium]